MQIGPQYITGHRLDSMHHMVMIVPIDPDIDKAKHIAEHGGDQWEKIIPVYTMRHFKFQHHDRDDDGEYTIAEGFETSFIHTIYGADDSSDTSHG